MYTENKMKNKKHNPGTILVVDDNMVICEAVKTILLKEGYQVRVFNDGQSCLNALSSTLPDTIFLDLFMPGISGLETLKQIKLKHRMLPVIILTGDDTMDNLLRAMDLGAHDYLTKPFDLPNLLVTARNAVQYYRMSVKMTQLEREVSGGNYPGLVGRSDPMRNLFKQMDLASLSDVIVLLEGERGTGRNLVAKAIHGASNRKEGPYLTFNCASNTDSQQETHLFGQQSEPGKLEQANRGTLFIDDISELILPFQTKLLHFLKTRTVVRADRTQITSDARVIVATHNSLSDLVSSGSFRRDLEHVISACQVRLPPLRERKTDIPLLTRSFLSFFSVDQDLHLSADAMELLMAYNWPGNVSELQNTLQKAVAVSTSDIIRADDLPSRIRGEKTQKYSEYNYRSKHFGQAPNSQKPTVEDQSELAMQPIERQAIEEAIRRSGGSVKQTSRNLGMGPTKLYEKLRKYRIV